MYDLADQLGHWRAPFNLALLLDTGAGGGGGQPQEVPKDLGRAGKLFRKLFKDRSL